MSQDAELLFEAVLKLAETDRAELAARLIDSLDPETTDDDVAASWRTEIERRAAEIDNGAVETVAWPDALRQILTDGDEQA